MSLQSRPTHQGILTGYYGCLQAVLSPSFLQWLEPKAQAEWRKVEEASALGEVQKAEKIADVILRRFSATAAAISIRGAENLLSEYPGYLPREAIAPIAEKLEIARQLHEDRHWALAATTAQEAFLMIQEANTEQRRRSQEQMLHAARQVHSVERAAKKERQAAKKNRNLQNRARRAEENRKRAGKA